MIFERLDDVAIVDDLLTHVDGCAVLLEGLLDGLDRAVDAGAVAARLGEEHALGAALRVDGESAECAIPRLRGTAEDM